jgi:formylglycine-generating enzyme required for sulfatase activity
MTEDRREAESARRLEMRLYRPEAAALRAPLERFPRWRDGLRAFLNDVSARTGILGPHDGPDSEWRFWHPTFREALAAEHLAGFDREEILDHARSIAGDEARWAEPYALLAGRSEDADALVLALAEANRDLALRAVATAQGLREETVRTVLRLKLDWRQRAAVFQRIPSLIDDPHRALALIDRLRRNTREGNDLYFLKETIGEVARRWPGHRQEAERLRERLFDHISPPPEALFAELPSKNGGRASLWAEVPAGRFVMGSPPDDGNADERPQREVDVTAPFRMARVPITCAQYRAFDSGYSPPERGGVNGCGSHPAVNLTWYAAMAFCRWLSAALPQTRGARLPTETEWEYACRAGSTSRFWPGDGEEDLARVGWYGANADDRTHPVAEMLPNPWGLYDVHGNVWEWTRSAYRTNSAAQAPASDNGGHPSGENGAESGHAPAVSRVARGGGCWTAAAGCRSAYRNPQRPDSEDLNLGFRVLLPGSDER